MSVIESSSSVRDDFPCGSPPLDRPRPQCFGANDPELSEYHDTEWGVPEHDDVALLELLTLLGFASGLSWRTVLSKRESFRAAFLDFDPEAVAVLTESDVQTLLSNSAIIRNVRKIQAAIQNARALVALHENGRTLSELMWSHAPSSHASPRSDWSQVPSQSQESESLARALKGAGFGFLGPVNTYAAMQTSGIVNDHIATCPLSGEGEGSERPR